MRLGTRLFGVVLVIIAGCATVEPDPPPGPGPNAVMLSGKVTNRRDVAAVFSEVPNESAIAHMTGVVGLLVARLAGSTPRHYIYTVESANGAEYSVPTQADIAVGTCLAFLVPKAQADEFSWPLNRVEIAPNDRCLADQNSPYDVTADQRLDANGNNALHMAVWAGQTKRALRIIEHKSVDFNSVNKFGATALYLAVMAGNTKIVQTLIDAGANPNIRDNYGTTPVMEAAKKENREILDLLKKAGAS